jgi:hypothetical protein
MKQQDIVIGGSSEMKPSSREVLNNTSKEHIGKLHCTDAFTM